MQSRALSIRIKKKLVLELGITRLGGGGDITVT